MDTGRLTSFAFDYKSFVVLVAFAFLAISITYVLYSYTSRILKERLQSRLVAIASTAATQFDSNDLEQITEYEDAKKPVFKKIVNQLQKIRAANENIQFAYLMRRTSDPNILAFIADADSLTEEDLDVNENGVLEDDEMVPLPGYPYEIDLYPVLRDEAFYHPAVDRELQPDQWGLIMAAYAPIFDAHGDAVAIVGLDILVNDFNQKTQETLLPFILFIFFLILALTLLTLLLVRLWSERVDAVKELDRQKDELLGIVSHQLNTPVTSLKWELEMLTDGDMGKFNSEQIETLNGMQNITTNLADLVSMILDVSRIQLGKMKVEKGDLDLNSFFKEMLDILHPKAEEKKINFEVKIPKNLPVAKLDKRLTRMTIENLLSNAIKYTPSKGQVLFSVKLNGKIMHCEVHDTGCGIPVKDQDKIFGKLFRASNVRNSVDGNGFGLYVAKGAIEGQGGKIWFESEEDKGTKFYIDLPLF